MSEHAAVVIVGAGPAGATAALLLARAGIDVRVLERAAFPREKACGDCLSAAAGALLDRLGLLPLVDELAPARLEGWRIRGPHGSGFGARFDDLAEAGAVGSSALAVPRAAFDAALLRAAVDAGARVEHGVVVEDVVVEHGGVRGVRVRRGGHAWVLRAALTIGADGLRSRVARRLGVVGRPGRRRKLSLTTHLELEAPLPPIGEMHVADGLCIGLAPVNAAGTLCNLTVVADSRGFGPAVRRAPRAFVRTALAGFPELPRAVRAAPLGNLLASGPFDQPVRPTIADGAALVGDAAGYFDPFTGQGIFHAMAAAERLAQVVIDAIAEGSPMTAAALRPYADAHRRLTGGPRRVQRLIDAVLARQGLAAPALRAVAARPALARVLLAVTGDLAPARDLLSAKLLLALATPHPRVDA